MEIFNPQDQTEKGMAEQIAKERGLVIGAMRDSFDIQDEPMVGPFWYDPDKKEVYGARPTYSNDILYYKSPQFKNEVRTGRQLHQNIWKKEVIRKRDLRFSGDYTKKPRGRVFEFKNIGFVVFTGKWIETYPEAKELIMDEFQLPADKTEFRIDSHWDIGHGWSQEI